MGSDPKVAEILIRMRADTAELRKATGDAKVTIRDFNSEMRAQTGQSREAVRLLNEDLGIHLPRALTNVISKMPAVSSAMNAAFDAVVVIALITAVVKITEKVVEFAQKNEEAARKNKEAWASTITSINQQNDSLELTKTKLENAIAKLEHRPQNKLKEAIEEAKVAAEELGRKLDDDIKKVAEVLKGEERNWAEKLFLGEKGGSAAAGISADVQFKFTQIAAGMFQGGTGEETVDQAAVLRQALADANARLAAAQQSAGSIVGRTAYSDANRVQEIQTLKELISGLQAMRQSLLGDVLIAQDKARQSYLESAGAGAKSGASGAATVPGPSGDQTGNAWLMGRTDNFGMTRGANADYSSRAAADLADAAALIAQNSAPIGGTAGISLPKALFQPVALGPQENAFRKEMDDMFAEWIHYSTDLKEVTKQFFEDMKKAVNTFNDEIIKSLTGEKTNWRGATRGALTGFAKTGLETAEGGLMKLLGLGGHAKADGYHMWMDNMPGVPGTAGNIVSKSGGGLLGMLNDSNFFSSLFGGRLFGAGGFFGGGHALGGAVAAGVPIDVGELGIERFTPMVPGVVTSNRDLARGGVTMHIDARGTDPALTRENFQRALGAVHAQAVRDSSRAIYEHSRRSA